MEFGIEKCAKLIMSSGKRNMSEGIEQPNQNEIRTLWKNGNLQILGNIGSGRKQTCREERKKKRMPLENKKRRNKIADVDYVVIEMKQPIT